MPATIAKAEIQMHAVINEPARCQAKYYVFVGRISETNIHFKTHF